MLRAVSDVAAGTGAAIRISGGPGSGKTGLLHQAAETARLQALVVGLSAPTPASPGPYLCEFLVVAAEQSGAVLLLDDLHLAHREAVLLVEDVARLTRGHRLAVIIAERPDARRWPGFEVATLAEAHRPQVDRDATADLSAEVTRALRRIAQLGDRFDRLEFTAASGHDPADAGQLLEQALGSGVIRVESGGYRFADPVTAARLVAQLAPALRPTVMNEIATRLIDLDATAARIAGLLLAAGEPAMAAPFALEAARIAAASGLYAEVLRWTEAVRDHVDDEAEPALLSLRADALAAVGDHAAVPAYRKAVATASPDQAAGLRTRLARAAVLSGDLASAEEALAGLEPNGGQTTAQSSWCGACSPTFPVISTALTRRSRRLAPWPWRPGHRTACSTSSPFRA